MVRIDAHISTAPTSDFRPPPDGNVFTQGLDGTDFDGDGVPNDGDADRQYACRHCTGGARRRCDDNCSGMPDSRQADADGDRVGDACETRPTVFNSDQRDLDRDGIGDACDPAPTTP